MPVTGPHVAFSDLARGREVQRIGGTYEEIARSGNHQGARSIGRVEMHGGLTITILFDDLRAVAYLRHSSPKCAYGSEDPCLLPGSYARWSSDRAQLGDKLAAALDHDNAALCRLTHQFRSVDREFANRGLPHVLHCRASELLPKKISKFPAAADGLAEIICIGHSYR
jgi:hypothetical protein